MLRRWTSRTSASIARGRRSADRRRPRGTSPSGPDPLRGHPRGRRPGRPGQWTSTSIRCVSFSRRWNCEAKLSAGSARRSGAEEPQIAAGAIGDDADPPDGRHPPSASRSATLDAPQSSTRCAPANPPPRRCTGTTPPSASPARRSRPGARADPPARQSPPAHRSERATGRGPGRMPTAAPSASPLARRSAEAPAAAPSPAPSPRNSMSNCRSYFDIRIPRPVNHRSRQPRPFGIAYPKGSGRAIASRPPGGRGTDSEVDPEQVQERLDLAEHGRDAARGDLAGGDCPSGISRSPS